MSASIKKLIRAIGLTVARGIGTSLLDYESGRSIGKALLIPWRGKIHVIGLETRVVPVFLPQKRLTYWKQEIGFTTHPPVDFPNVRRVSGSQDCAELDKK
jgi:hypothetical protein